MHGKLSIRLFFPFFVLPVGVCALLSWLAYRLLEKSLADSPVGELAGPLLDVVPKSEKILFSLAILIALLVLLGVYRLALRTSVLDPVRQLRCVLENAAAPEMLREITNILPAGSREFEELSQAVADALKALDTRIHGADREKKQLETVFESMVEVVIVLDGRERFTGVNRAASLMMGLPSDAILGKSIIEVIRNVDLQRFAHLTLRSDDPVEDEMTLTDGNGKERYVQAHGVPLRGKDGKSAGAVIVLNDLTRIRGLERIRRDFVANVSHELKTPITSIKGFVETLLDGALEDGEHARKFLSIAKKQADRLDAIVEDLLTLSRIEQEDEKAEILLEDFPIRSVLVSAIDVCLIKARAKNIALALRCDNSLRARINASLLEEAVVNLVVNAVKYSDEGSEVIVAAEKDGEEVHIGVQDFGIGIAAEHLPRLFERFYRSDKARSRKLGGTGLGLAIVKHIVKAHHGRVGVESAPGKGSTFTISLPRPGGKPQHQSRKRESNKVVVS